MNDKPIRRVTWNDMTEWIRLLVPGVIVIWLGANNVRYRATIIHGHNGNYRLKFEDDGHESEPCYIEQFVGIDLPDEYIEITR